VTALAVRPDGTLIAGTTPGGRVYTIDSEGRQVEAARDADRRARLGAGARRQERHGLRGHGRARKDRRRSTPAARRAPSGTSGDKHVVSLLAADEKHLYAGTSEEAILYTVSLDGEAGGARRLRRGGGCARSRARAARYTRGQRLRARGVRAADPGAAAAPRGTKITVASSGSPASAGSLPRPGQRKAKAALYRLEPDGRMEQMFSIPDGYFTDAQRSTRAAAPTSGPAARGRVYRVSPDRTAALAIDVPERQALALLRAGNGFLVGTGDVGGIYRAAPAAPKQATYLSRVLDGEYRSRWGCSAGTARTTSPSRAAPATPPSPTRPGAASRRWRSRAPTAEGGVGQVASPPAPYVQYRATFGAPRRAARRGDARLPAAEPARAHHRAGPADSGGAAAPAIGGLGSHGGEPPRRAARARTRPSSSCAGRWRTPTATSSTTGSPSARRTTPSGARWAGPIR
jgi:hypothetical protein